MGFYRKTYLHEYPWGAIAWLAYAIMYNHPTMASLSDRLQSLGVNLGAHDLKPPRGKKYPLEEVVDGEIRQTPHGETFVVTQRYPAAYRHGGAALQLSASLEMLAAWARDERIVSCEPGAFAFLDTETTGLAGGGGTYAFLVGVGRFEGDGFHLAQFFMRDPTEEPALLAALEEFLGPCETLVTFNGKAFDVPLLNTRYISNGSPSPLPNLAHLDVLHIARRLWRERLPSRALAALERDVLGLSRTEEDVPGWMIPQLYFDYLRSQDARPMRGVLYHNAFDILSLAALTNHAAHMLADPLNGAAEHPTDLVAIGKLYADLGYLDKAAQIMQAGLQEDLPGELFTLTMERLSYLHRRRGDLTAALSLWIQAAADQHVYAHVELAKYYEHRERDLDEALRWTQAALAIITLPDFPRIERYHWKHELEHRQARLERRLRQSRSPSKPR